VRVRGDGTGGEEESRPTSLRAVANLGRALAALRRACRADRLHIRGLKLHWPRPEVHWLGTLVAVQVFVRVIPLVEDAGLEGRRWRARRRRAGRRLGRRAWRRGRRRGWFRYAARLSGAGRTALNACLWHKLMAAPLRRKLVGGTSGAFRIEVKRVVETPTARPFAVPRWVSPAWLRLRQWRWDHFGEGPPRALQCGREGQDPRWHE
jgi:hypothetical protein